MHAILSDPHINLTPKVHLQFTKRGEQSSSIRLDLSILFTEAKFYCEPVELVMGGKGGEGEGEMERGIGKGGEREREGGREHGRKEGMVRGRERGREGGMDGY